jgi:hypothetical protein
VVKTTSPAWDRALPKDQPEYSEPSSRTSFACRTGLAWGRDFARLFIPDTIAMNGEKIKEGGGF